MYHLVTYAKDNMQKELLSEIYRDNTNVALLEENEVVTHRREEVKTTLSALRKAEAIVNSV